MPITPRRSSRSGFTLIELLVVIAIIGLLASVVLASLNTARAKGMDAQRMANLKQVQNALELYASSNNGQYPTATGWTSTCGGWVVATQNNAVPGLVPPYIPSLPLDPQVNTGASTCCYLYYSNGVDYKYMMHYCPTSVACMGNAAGRTFVDPARTWSCAVYTPGAAMW